ncbi:MAG: hypothetical protein V3U86_03315 [Acidobacteriota bacterium]
MVGLSYAIGSKLEVRTFSPGYKFAGRVERSQTFFEEPVKR